MNTKEIKQIILITITLILLYQPVILYAQTVYIERQSFTIPWGDDPGELRRIWQKELPDPPEGERLVFPGPFNVNNTGGCVIKCGKLVKYSLEGEFIGEISGIGRINRVCVANGGEVLTSGSYFYPQHDESKLNFLNSSMELVITKALPGRVVAIYPSSNGGWWVRYGKGYVGNIEDCYIECGIDGSCSEPVVMFSGSSSNPSRPKFRYFSPNGELYPEITDKFGYTYLVNKYTNESFYDYAEPAGTFQRYSPSDELVYEHSDVIIEDWDVANQFHPTWDGDFFHQYGTPEGLVVTRYELNLNPVCRLEVVTIIPPGSVPGPFPVEFDATDTYDLNEGDELTFHWDFDGDHIFDEPVDDAYTGDPDNPTHEYTEDYAGPVFLKVTDNYQGECGASVAIIVDIT